MRAYLKIFSIACVLLSTHSSDAVFAQPVNGDRPAAPKENVPPSQLIVACSPDKPIVRPGEAIRMRAYASSPAGKPFQYTWAASTGRVEGQGAEVSWDFTDVAVGAYEAKVSVSGAKGVVADCAVRVAVQARPKERLRGTRETGRSFLIPKQGEEKGYGLYSYLLLGSRPTTASRERYLKTIEEYLRFPDITRFEAFNAPRRTLNITYLPLVTFPGQAILDRLADEQYREAAEWMLKQYDYERARLLLRGLPGSPREGPYIVSFLKPPDWREPPSRPYLYQDQSSMPPHLASLWMKEFLNQAAQEQFWQERTAAQLALKLRTSLRILATGLPEVRKALDEWIAWSS
jgi:hypothetical protein